MFRFHGCIPAQGLWIKIYIWGGAAGETNQRSALYGQNTPHTVGKSQRRLHYLAFIYISEDRHQNTPLTGCLKTQKLFSPLTWNLQLWRSRGQQCFPPSRRFRDKSFFALVQFMMAAINHGMPQFVGTSPWLQSLSSHSHLPCVPSPLPKYSSSYYDDHHEDRVHLNPLQPHPY